MPFVSIHFITCDMVTNLNWFLYSIVSTLTSFDLTFFEKCECVMISVRPASQPNIFKWQTLWCCDFLWQYKYLRCQTLHDGSAHWALPSHTTFSDLDCISRSQQCQTVSTVMHVQGKLLTVFICSFERTLTLAFSQTPLKLEHSNIAWL